MLLIVGLGNPDSKYQNTRHNIGFMILDRVRQKLLPVKKSKWQEIKELKSLVVKGENFVLAKPQVAMNVNGLAVNRLISNFKLQASSLLVVHDDLDLPLGEIKIVKKRGAAGHRGVESVIKNLGDDDFWRLRVGIGRPLTRVGMGLGFRHEGDSSKEVVSYVLSTFSRYERQKAHRVVNQVAKLVVQAVEEGMERVAGKHGI